MLESFAAQGIAPIEMASPDNFFAKRRRLNSPVHKSSDHGNDVDDYVCYGMVSPTVHGLRWDNAKHLVPAT
jgi:hypothetical protein